MKNLKYVVGCLALISAIVVSAGAQTATDNAGNYTGWGNNGTQTTFAPSNNQGTGFGAWTTAAVGSGFAGEFLGNSTANGAGGHLGINSSANSDAWGEFANTANTASTVRPFDIPLTLPTQYVTIDMENGYVQTGGTVGLGLQDSEGDNLMELFFVGGNGAYTLYNGSTTNGNTGISFTDTGLAVTFTLEAGNKLNVSVTGMNGNSASYTTNGIGMETQTDMTISQIRLFNFNAGSGSSYNAFFNNLTVVPEPSSIMLVIVGLLGAVGLIRRRNA